MLSQLDGKLLILKGESTWGAKGGKFYRGFDFIPATLYSLNCVRVIDSKTGLNIECACPRFACNRFYPKLRYRIFKLCAPVIVPGIVQVLSVYRSSLKFRRVFVSTRNLAQTWVWLNSSWIWYFTQRSCSGVTRNFDETTLWISLNLRISIKSCTWNIIYKGERILTTLSPSENHLVFPMGILSILLIPLLIFSIICAVIYEIDHLLYYREIRLIG